MKPGSMSSKSRVILLICLALFMLACGMSTITPTPVWIPVIVLTSTPEVLMKNYIDIPAPTHVVTVTAETLRIREDHSSSSEEIGVLHMGAVERVSEYYYDRITHEGWYKLADRRGWIYADWTR